MIVRCTHCDAAYAVDDGKIENKRFGFTCPKCGQNVVIDNRMKAQPEDMDLTLDEKYSFDDTLPGGSGESLGEDAALSRESAIGADDIEIPTDDELASAMADLDVLVAPDDVAAKKSHAGKAVDADTGMESDIFDAGEEKITAPAEEVIFDDESLNMEDFGAGLDVDARERKPAAARKKSSGEYNEMSFFEEDATVAAGKASRDADEFSPLEEDIDFNEIIGDDAAPVRKDRKAVRNIEEEPLVLSEEISLDDEIRTDEIFSRESEPSDIDESITIDLDSLDIELDEKESQKVHVQPDEDVLPAELEDLFAAESDRPAKKHVDDDFDTTIDLDSLDITLDEVEELKKGVSMDEDERITLDDTGLSIDELGAENVAADDETGFIEDSLADEDIKLNLKEIDPTLSVDDLSKGVEADDKLLIEEIPPERLPEIDIDRFQKEAAFDEAIEPVAAGAPKGAAVTEDEDYLDIETRREFSRYQTELEAGYEKPGDVVPGGCVNFSIDYSLGFSRLGALLRLFFIYPIRLLPHYVVSMIYIFLSAIVGYINWLLVLTTGRSEDDFTAIQEKTLRYCMSLSACAVDVVEDTPMYAGGKNIDYALQMNVIYPVRYSRVLAFLRVSCVGILLVALPHLMMLTILSLGALLFCLIGFLSILLLKKWPGLLFDFMVRYYRYAAGVYAFLIGLVDRYPSFRFE